MRGEDDQEAGAEVIVKSRCNNLVDGLLFVELLVLGDIAQDGGANAGIKDAVIADEVGGEDPDAEGFVAQPMQDVGSKKDSDRGIREDGNPTGCNSS